MHLLYLIASVLIVGALGGHGRVTNSRVQHQWKLLEFGFNNNNEKNFAADKVKIIPANARLVDVQPQYKNGKLARTFVTLPRQAAGIPYSLATVSNNEKGGMLMPYPSLNFHVSRSKVPCTKIVSAYRVSINECNQMWVLDNGDKKACPPKLVLFDLKSDHIIHTYDLESSVYTPGQSVFFNFAVVNKDSSSSGNCKNSNIYMGDLKNHGLVVYDFMKNSAWRVENTTQYSDSKHIQGSFADMGETFGIATDKKDLYFHPFESSWELSVPLSLLDDKTNFVDKGNVYLVSHKRRSACLNSAMDSHNNLYCLTAEPFELTKWNTKSAFNNKNVEKLPLQLSEVDFVGGLKVVKNGSGKEELWVTSSKHQVNDSNEHNFRVVVFPL